MAFPVIGTAKATRSSKPIGNNDVIFVFVFVAVIFYDAKIQKNLVTLRIQTINNTEKRYDKIVINP